MHAPIYSGMAIMQRNDCVLLAYKMAQLMLAPNYSGMALIEIDE